MTNRKSRRQYRKAPGRRVWVFSELNHDLRPEQVAKIITAAGLEQARLEAAAQQQADEDATGRKGTAHA
ncbi:hypothetical protein J2D78_11665 [Microbacterium maritypicum]|uniref:hypothetical protein n=1 Tax=Microbacterium maritypicum TaxID=33918 RepID=UPI001B32E7A6|nr:hypothetical protein [Microbacterium liquefaciens]MBP5802741.1 hypothetical protein [Microbacterium liquefaciens]